MLLELIFLASVLSINTDRDASRTACFVETRITITIVYANDECPKGLAAGRRCMTKKLGGGLLTS